MEKTLLWLHTVGMHGDVVVGGSGTVIIGDSHTPASFVPPVPLAIQKTFGQAFSITDSETDTPFAFRDFVATVKDPFSRTIILGSGEKQA